MGRPKNPPKPKRPRGNQPHIPTERNRTAIILAKAMRMSMEDLALYLGISRDTIDRHYPDAIISGKVMCDLRAAASFMKQVDNGDMTAIKFYMINNMGFKEKSELNVKQPDTVEDFSLPELNRALARFVIEGKAKVIESAVPDRPILPAEIHDEPSGHGKRMVISEMQGSGEES